MELKNYFKQISVLVTIYADFECNWKSVESYEDSHPKKYQDHISLMRNLVNRVLFLEVKMLLMNLLRQFLKSIVIAKKKKKKNKEKTI